MRFCATCGAFVVLRRPCFQAVRMSINRVVTILTPLVFAPAASVVVGLVARYFPGLPTPDPAEVVALEAAAFLSAVGIAGKWLHGQSKWETLIERGEQYVRQVEAHYAIPSSSVAGPETKA